MITNKLTTKLTSMSNWNNSLTPDIIVKYIIPNIIAIDVENLYITEKRINDAMKDASYSRFIWNLFWHRTERKYLNGEGYWREDDILLLKETYKEGRLEGEQLAYYPELDVPTLAYSRWYKNGVLEGEELHWDRKGELITKTPFLNGKPNDKVYMYGKRRCIVSIWENGQEQYSYDNDTGELISSNIYNDNGEMYRHTIWIRDQNHKVTHTRQFYHKDGEHYEYKNWFHDEGKSILISHLIDNGGGEMQSILQIKNE